MNDLVFEKARKVLLSKQKELKKKGKGKRTKASIALKSVWVNKTHFIVAVNWHIIVWMKSQYLWNKQITSWLVRLYDFYSLVVKNSNSLARRLARSFAILHNSWIKIVRTHQLWSNLYIRARSASSKTIRCSSFIFANFKWINFSILDNVN